MHNKKIIAKGLIVSILLLNAPTDAMADMVENYKSSVVEKENDNFLKENKFEEFFYNLFNKFKQPKEVVEINKNIRAGTVKEITLGDGEFVPNLNGNAEGYETVRITTTGGKKLVGQDYSNLRASGIPKIDLSNASSDEIPAGAFTNATHLTEFKFPQELRIIGGTGVSDGAFKGCSNLASISDIPSTVTNIGYYAFFGCSNIVGNLIIPKGVVSINDYAFYKCSGFTGDLVIPDSVVSIGNAAFYECSGFSGSLVIPSSITTIKNSSFYGCSGFNGNLTISNSVTEIGQYAFYMCSGFTGDLVIPDSVTLVEDSAFRGCSGFDGELIISNNLTTIKSSAFQDASRLTGNLRIPKSVKSIGTSAFEGCRSFTGDLVIPDSISSITYNVFSGCSGISKLVIPESVTSIEMGAFQNCSGLVGDLIILPHIKKIGENAFYGCNGLNRIVIKIDSSDSASDYKKSIIDGLPNSKQTVIDMPYDLNISGTWLESTNKTIGKPSIKNIINEEESELVSGGIGKKVSLYIPAPYEEDNITVLKDGKPYVLPIINEENKYIFTEDGSYEIEITTDLGNVSNISFRVESVDYTTIEESINQAEESRNPEDIEAARDLVNKLPESIKKDEFQGRLDAISPNIEFEVKNTTANLDVYIKSENLLSLSLNTNSVTFEDFSGVEDDEKLNAIMLTVNSSLPYDVKAYLPVEITGSKYGEALDKEIFNIRANGELDYQTFTDTETPLTLISDQEAGNDNNHGIDFKLASDLAFKNDIYKATVKFEVEQK